MASKSFILLAMFCGFSFLVCGLLAHITPFLRPTDALSDSGKSKSHERSPAIDPSPTLIFPDAATYRVHKAVTTTGDGHARKAGVE
jgi:hypothetical protein